MATGNTSSGEVGSFASEFERLLNTSLDSLKVGKVVKGTVVAVNKEVVTVDIGFKSEGVVPTEQFFDPTTGAVSAKVGDVVEVFILALEGDTGQVLLSKEKAGQKKVWDNVEQAYKAGALVSGKIVSKVKGGLQVDIGIPAFLPGSQIDIRPHRHLDKFLDQTMEFKVIKISRDKGNIVLSRRAVILSERDNLRSETLKVLGEGVVMEGTVKNVTEYGAFVDLGGIDGLLHITDISWGRINHPSEKLSVGQVVPVVVLKYDAEKERVSLGMKQLKADPWLTVNERFPIGGRVAGKIMSVTDFGAFVELEEGVEGLVHVSEMSWSKKNKNPSKLVKEGETVEAVILGIDTEQHRISLGVKQLIPNPWEELQINHPIGSKVKGKVRTTTEFGVFIGIDDTIDGLVHLSDLSWTKRVRDPKELADVYKKGDDVEAVVLDIDIANERLSLGIKQLDQDPWTTLPQRYPEGTRVKGKITSVPDFGVFVEIEDGIEGLIHTSELALEKDKTASETYKVGDAIECVVLNVDREERRISLGLEALRRREKKEGGSEFGVTFADLLKQKISGPQE